MEVDAAISIFANLEEKINDTHKMVGMRKTRNPKPTCKPIGNSLISVTATNPQYLQIDDTPAVGRTWFVRKVGIFGTDGHTTVTGAVADIYFGPSEEVSGSTAIAVPVSAFLYQQLSNVTIPLVQGYGHWDRPMHSHEHIYAWLYTVPVNQAIELVAEVDEYWTCDVEETRQ